MTCQGGGHGWRTLNPTVAVAANGQTQAQAVMSLAQVVETTDDKEAGGQRFWLLSQGPGAPGQPGQAQTKGGIEPFNVSGIDDTECFLGRLAQAVDLTRTPLNKAALNLQASWPTSLDDLNDGDIGPGIEPRTTRLPKARHFGAKGTLNRLITTYLDIGSH